METIPAWSYIGLTLITTLALAFHASEWVTYRATGKLLSHSVILVGWSSIVGRLWHGMGGDQSISLSGATGLLLLACWLILRALGR